VARASNPEGFSDAVMVAALFPPRLHPLFVALCGVTGAFLGLLSGIILWAFWRVHEVRSASRGANRRGGLSKPPA